jgi:CPA2 family monovalent cation:H+ antiporter-2
VDRHRAATPSLVQQGRRAGHRVYFGDASRVEFWSAAAWTTPGGGRDHGLARGRRGGGRHGPRGASRSVHRGRARDARHAARLYELGATDAVPETIEASLQLSEAVLVDIGVPMGLVIASIHERRDEYRKVLNRPGRPGRPHAPGQTRPLTAKLLFRG